MVTLLLCLAVFLSATMIDYAHARCVVAIQAGAAHRAALWSMVQWAGATVGFIIAVKVTFWVLPFEAAGLYTGTMLAVGKHQQGASCASPKTLAQTLSQRIDLDAVLASLSTSSITRSGTSRLPA